MDGLLHLDLGTLDSLKVGSHAFTGSCCLILWGMWRGRTVMNVFLPCSALWLWPLVKFVRDR